MTWNLIGRLLAAGLLGTLIGLDREYRAKDAGFRTHFLVSLGSALFMIVSKYGFADILGAQGVGLDPSRIAAQVVSGIGFIGAGTIIFHRRIVRGLTTAASLWATAGIGMASGAGMLPLAAGATVLTLVGLEALSPLFRSLGTRRTLVVFTVADKQTARALFERIRTEDYLILSYELSAQPQDTGTAYRVSMIIKSRKSRDEGRYIRILQEHPDVTIERIE